MKQWISVWTYKALTGLTRLVLVILVRWEVENQSRIPSTGGVVLVGNHMHLFDPALIAASSSRRVHPMAKREIFKIPLIGWIFWIYGAFPVRRFAADIGALRTARNHLQGGEAVLMFPEGTRSVGSLMPALPGAAMVALLAGVPVVPFAITGTESLGIRRALLGRLTGRKICLRVQFGESFELPAGSSDTKQAEMTTDLMMRKVASLLPENYRGAYGPDSEGTIVFARQSDERPDRRKTVS